MFRIVGLTLNSSSLLHLVTSLYHQVCFLYDEDAFLPVDITLKGTLQAFRGLLHDIRDKTLHKGPLTLVLDGVDKVHDMVPKHLSYLMGSLPQGITLLMSMQNSGPLYETAKAMEGTEFVHCPTFSREQPKPTSKTIFPSITESSPAISSVPYSRTVRTYGAACCSDFSHCGVSLAFPHVQR